MPDQLHLFVTTDDEKITLAARTKSLKNTISKALRSTGVAPLLVEDIFKALNPEWSVIAQKWNDVRDNPVRAGLVRKAEDWPFVGEIFALEYRFG